MHPYCKNLRMHVECIHPDKKPITDCISASLRQNIIGFILLVYWTISFVHLGFTVACIRLQFYHLHKQTNESNDTFCSTGKSICPCFNKIILRYCRCTVYICNQLFTEIFEEGTLTMHFVIKIDFSGKYSAVVFHNINPRCFLVCIAIWHLI